VVFQSNFDSSIPPEFSGGPHSIVGVEGYAGIGHSGNQFSGNFLRNSTLGQPSRLTLTNLPAHTHVNIGFLLAVIDSWDGSDLNFSPDFLTITVDGQVAFSETFTNIPNFAATYPNSATSPLTVLSRNQQRGFNTDPVFFLDSAYDMNFESSLQNIPHTSSSLVIEWFAGGAGWEGGTNESWAIDNLKVTVSAVPEPTSVVLFCCGTALFSIARKRRAVS
jgi:hypothetical protein